MITLTHLTNDEDRWDAIRYLTASAVIIYARVSHIARFQEAMIDASEWERMLKDEQEWLGMPQEKWEKVMGWPRTREEAANFTGELNGKLGLSDIQPARLAKCPPLLKKHEVEELRKYPGGYMSLVLQTWTMQVLKSNDELKGPLLSAAQNAIFKLRSAAYGLRGQLGMPVPLPYFHALTMLQNICFSFYTYSLLSFRSHLTPIILLVCIMITVGMREVATALSNPFGEDDVDFPVNKWVAQLRSCALVVHPDNVIVKRPLDPERMSTKPAANGELAAKKLPTPSDAPKKPDDNFTPNEEAEEDDDDGGD